jgi:hypothetical protein
MSKDLTDGFNCDKPFASDKKHATTEDRAYCPFKATTDYGGSIVRLFRCIEKKCRLWNPHKNDCGFVNW